MIYSPKTLEESSNLFQGLFREKVSLQPVECVPIFTIRDDRRLIPFTDYSKLPPNPTVDLVFLLDPLIATGGTAVAALNMITDWGVPGES